MARLEGSLPRGHRYCSVRPALDKFSCSTVISTINPCCRNSFVVYPAWIAEHLDPKRCQWISHCLPSLGPAWKSLGDSGGTDCNVPVLARGEQDGFYYPGTVKEEIESERGMFLVEFAKPLVSRGRHPVCVQKTAQDGILEYVNGMKHSLLPGDRVLAPWEPDRARYGPGTVLRGIETRDPLRASEDEEITVQFWNDKQVKLPRGVALWIPPSLWERIVEMIHMPFTSRLKPRPSQDSNSSIFPCSPKAALIPVCALCSLAKHCLLCSPCWPHFHHHCAGGVCCSLAWGRCICCCHPCAAAWWPLPSRSLVFQDKAEEAESSSELSPGLLELKGTKEGEAAAVATSSPSSDSERDLKPSPTKSTLGDSAANTGSSCLEKSRLRNSARPEGEYWKKNHYKSHSSNSGPGSCTKDHLESKVISTGDMSSVAPAQQSAMFETTEQTPRGQLTRKKILRNQDFKPSLREGFAASEEQRYKAASDDKCEVTCAGADKPDVTESVRAHLQQSRERHDQPEFSTYTTDQVRG
ncbi:LOW QUALITY PROTEIN: uncharacterized protein C11orf16 homolog [Passer montanus]|uniref:LOW QUALITY PROTEIN: uncharacterized protein C11orf16 homolog n=1 Tax=Passer montanus TaxID=9160 RepID=UPI00196032CE|nr:LOW QUALITY PROTEIN: uncharacterized protein C11orf16 homolog [Passer montanus]